MDRETTSERTRPGELGSLDTVERDERLDDQRPGEDARTELDLLAARVRAARLAGA